MIQLPGGMFVIDAHEAAMLATVRPHEDAWWRRNGAVIPRPLDELLAGLGSAVGAREADASASDGAGSASVPIMAAGGSDLAPSSWWSTTATAKELGITTRAVVKAATAGALRARRGRGHAWRIDPVSVAEYADERAGRGPGRGPSTVA